jgi:peptide/nickel transport system permease protein
VAREKILNLNHPLWDRYWIWLTHALQGNLGTTIQGQDVASELWSHLFVTLRLVVIATLVAIVVGISMGVIAAVRQNKLTDHAITVTNFILLATPVFVLGLALKEFVAIPINQHVGTTIFYTNGEQSPDLSGSFFSRLPDYAAHTALPVITLILISYASWAIYQRSSMIETLDADHVRLARAKGLSQRRVLIRHVLRNALIPVTTVIALDFAAVLGGAIITEIVFGWQGLGQWYLNGVNNLDANVMLAYLLITGTFVILFNLAADILYGVLDPRIRYG